MKDEFKGQRLPDLPNVGYSTRRERLLSDAIMTFLRDTERNRIYLLVLVCEGREKFRRVALKAWKHLKIDEQAIDAVYGYLVLLAGNDPQSQLNTLAAMGRATRAGLVFPGSSAWPVQ